MASLFAGRSPVAATRKRFIRSAVEQEFDDEISDHLDRDIADHMKRGTNAREARRQAIADLGGVDNVRKQLRDEHGISMLEDLGRDARFAARRLARNPRYAMCVANSDRAATYGG